MKVKLVVPTELFGKEVRYEASRDIWGVAGGQVVPCLVAGQTKLESGSS